MKINAKYGIVAALTLAAFVAPSVGAYTAGSSDYTKTEQKLIDDCVAATTKSSVINTKIVESTTTTGKYQGITHTIYEGIGKTTPVNIDKAVEAVCVIDLEYSATLMEDVLTTMVGGTSTPAIKAAQDILDAKEAQVVKYYGGGSKSVDAESYTSGSTTTFDYEVGYKINGTGNGVNMTTGVYKYVGNYKGEIKAAEKRVSEKKDAIKELETALGFAQAAYNESENPTTDGTKTALDAAKDAVNKANVELAALEKGYEDAQKAGTKATRERDEAKAALATAKAKNAKKLVENAEKELAAATTELNKLSEQKEDAKTTGEKDKIQKEIDKQNKTIEAINSKIKALGGAADKATSEADKATEEAEEAANNSISAATISGVARAYTYNGSAIAPTVTVTKAGTALTAGTDYTVDYKNNVKVGTATITITGNGKYTGTKTVKFYIDPAKSSIKKVSVGAKKMTVTVKKGNGASGVQIAYRVKGTKSWKYTTTSTSKTIKSLKKGKKYQVVVRSYTTKSGKVTNYSGWSSTKTTAKIK